MESEVNEVKEVEVLENEFDKLIESMPLEDGFYDEDEDDDNLDDEDDDDYEFDYAQVSSSAATKQASDIVIQSEVDVPDLFVQPIQNSDQLFGRGVESVWQHGRAVNRERKIKKLRTGRTAGKVLPKEVSIPLGEAQMHFVNKEYNEAIEKLSIVARLAPRLSDPYHILGLIYEESGDILRALQFYSLAASYSIKPAELSKKIAYLATDVGEYDQAMLYVNKALKFKSDPKLVFLRLRIKVESGRVRSADLTVKQLLERFPLRRKYLLDYGDLCQRNGCGESSVAAFLKYINIVTNSSKNSFNEPAVDISDTSTLGSRKTTAEEVDMADRVSAIWYACRRVVDQWLDKPLQKLLHYSTRSLYLIDQCSKYIRSLAEEGEEVDVTPPPDVLLLHGLSLFRSKVEGDENVALELVKPILSKPAAYLPPTSDISATIAETGDDGFELMSFFLRQYLRLAVKLGLDGRQAAAKKLAEATLNALADLTKQISVPLDIGAIAEKPVSELARWRADAESERRRVVCNQLWRRLGLCFEQRLHDSERALSAYLQALEVARIGNDSESLCRFASLGLTHNESVRSSVKDLVTAHLVILLNQFEADTSTEPTATRANNLIKVQPPVANVEVPTEGGEETLDGEVDADQVDEEVEEPTMTDAPKEDDDGEEGGEEDALASHTNALRLAAKHELRGATGCHLYSKKQLVEELK